MIIAKRTVGQIFIILSFLLITFFPLLSSDLQSENQNYSKQEAEKVLRLIDRIQKEQMEREAEGVREVVVTEGELNSYIAYRIEAEGSEVLKELRLKIYEKNRLEGKIYIDLRGQDLPKILRPEMNFYLDGTIEVKDRMARLKLKSIYLESKKISPEMLNMVIYLGSKSQGTESFRLDDWFELPYGIKNIESENGSATFSY